MIKKLPATLIITLIALVSFVLFAGLVAGCGDKTAAGELVEESNRLRQAATDRFRRQTAAIDSIINTVASGSSLLAGEIEAASGTASQEYESSIADLKKRSDKLEEAAALELSDNYREYLRLLSESNDRFIAALTVAAEVPDLIIENEVVFSGWNEIGAAEVLDAIEAKQQQVEAAYEEAEALRAQAEKLREDNPGDF